MKTCSALRKITQRFIVALLMPASLVVAQDAVKNTAAVKLAVTADRTQHVYKAGETATFTIDVTQDGKPVETGNVVCTLSEDGWKPREPQTVAINNGKATITGTLEKPGFLLLKATSGNSTTLAGAAFDPLLIKPSLPVPDDFDQFWNEQKAALAKVEPKATLTPVKVANEKIEAFDVRVDCLGAQVSGYFGRPKNAKPKSLPAMLFVHGAGVYSSNLGNTNWCLEEGGVLAFDINAHGIANGQPKEFYTDLANGELKDYRHAGRQNRDECYFKGMFLRVVRAIDFLTAQPEWDGKTVVVYGTSQGGFQALAAAGIDPRVTFIAAGVPAGCDHTGMAADRISGWPKLVALDAAGKADPLSLEASRYVDCVNFASRAKCRGAVVTVGYIDTVCPPTSVYAAYNALPCAKKIHADVAAGHASTPAGSQFMRKAALDHLREMKAK